MTDYCLEIVTPLLLGGAEARGKPQLRAAPFRGEIRYWLRTIRMLPPKELKEYESNLMGDTDYGSPVTVRVRPASSKARLKSGRFELLLHLEKDKRQYAWGFVDKQQIILEMIPHPLSNGLSPEVKQAVSLWLALGSAGKRARRGMGSMQLANQTANDGAGLADQVGALLEQVHPDVLRLDYTPGDTFPNAFCDNPFPYPAFAPGRWMVLVCKEGFPTYADALYDFWAKHRSAKFAADRIAFGYIQRDLKAVHSTEPDQPPPRNQRASDRRASPFHLHIARTQAGFREKNKDKAGYHLVFTAFHAAPPPSIQSWQKVQALFAELWKMHQGTLFYNPCPEDAES